MATSVLRDGLRNPPSACWQERLELAIESMLKDKAFRACIDHSHVADTPKRVRHAFEEQFAGVWQDPGKVLTTSFIAGRYDQMVIVADVPFVSWCAHHLSPFIGTYTFGYLPHKRIVGLSKIPRMVQIFCARPQVQEKLSNDITHLFQKIVRPQGCGIIMEAMHTCACVRGVKLRFRTRTTSLTKSFKQPAIKSELLIAVKNA